MISGTVFDIQKFSLHDGPGIRTTVFLKGCGLRCWWCHNPESQRPAPELMLHPQLCIGCGACVEACPQHAIQVQNGGFITDRELCEKCGTCVDTCYADARTITGQTMTVADVLATVTRDTTFYDESGGGVTFSGGEPLLQPDFLLALLQACKQEGLHTVVDTCGHAPTANLEAILPYTDLFLYDLKLMDAERHRTFTGASNTLLLQNLHLLAKHQHPVIIRVPLIPGINDDDDNIRQLGKLVSTLPSVQQVNLLPYHRIGGDKHAQLGRLNPMPPTDPPTDDQMAAIKQTLASYGLPVEVGG